MQADRYLRRKRRPGADAERRNYHGRRECGASPDCRGGGRLRCYGTGKVPADIRRDGGVARMADPKIVKSIMDAVTIPVMAKCRIGHFAEAQILESLDVDFIDESEVLTPADNENHIDKHEFKVPFVCGARNLGEKRYGE
eukprot:Em0016g87a